MHRSSAWLPLLIVALSIPISAAASDLNVGNAWISLPILDEDPHVYFAIQNRGDQPRKIVGGSSARCEKVEIHRAVLKDGVMASEVLDEMEIPAGGAVAFAPRGLFLLLVDADRLTEDESVPIELELADGEKLQIEAVVRDD